MNVNDQVLREKLETLDGTRNRTAIRKAAVRISDLEALLQISASLKSTKAAGSTPTAAEFDALVDDVAMLHQRMLAVVDALQTRILI